MNNRYDAWLRELCKLLVHPSALSLTMANDDGTLRIWCKYGARPQQVANILNERWRVHSAQIARAALAEMQP